MKKIKWDEIKMFEDRSMNKFIWALLGFASIIIPGPIVPIVSFIIAIAVLVYKIKRAKESPEGFEALMLEIIILIIVIVVDIGFFAMRISIENEYNKYNYSSSSKQEMSASELAETAIYAYQLGNLSQFSDTGNHLNAIKSGFLSYLQDDLGLSNATLNGNRITCNIGTDTIIFTITKNDIKYTVK